MVVAIVSFTFLGNVHLNMANLLRITKNTLQIRAVHSALYKFNMICEESYVESNGHKQLLNRDINSKAIYLQS